MGSGPSLGVAVPASIASVSFAACLLDGDDGAVHPAPADLGHDDDQAPGVGWQAGAGGGLGLDRGLRRGTDLLADLRDLLVEVAQRDVVGLVALEPLVEHGHVHGLDEAVALLPRRRDLGLGLVEQLHRAGVLGEPAVLGGRHHEPVVLGQRRAHPGRGDGADRQPCPGGVQAVRRVERRHERGVPGDDRVGDGQGCRRRADIGHGRQVVAQCGGPGDHVRDQAVAVGDGGIAAGGVEAVEGGERAARLAAEGLDLAGQRREVGLRGVEHRRDFGVAGRGHVGPRGRAGRVVHAGHDARRTERDGHDDRQPDEPAGDPAEGPRHPVGGAWSRCRVRR